jgi:Spy/CpxP family protein refolding chaperone
MFTKVILSIVGLMFFAYSTAIAQPGNGRGQGQGQGFRGGEPNEMGFGQVCRLAFLDLSDDQQKQMEALRTKHLSETQGYRNELNEKEAKLGTLRTAAKPDMAQINQVVKDMGDIKLKMAQSREAHIQDIRKVLTDAQRAEFDAHAAAGGRGMGKGHHGGGFKGNCPNR